MENTWRPRKWASRVRHWWRARVRCGQGAFLIFVFGDCELDLDRFELRRAGPGRSGRLSRRCSTCSPC